MAEMEGIKCVLLDIEGTVCPISFVKETLVGVHLHSVLESSHYLIFKLFRCQSKNARYADALKFPYAIKALPDVLATKWNDEDFKSYREAIPSKHTTSPEALQAHVADLTQRDVKVAYLKNLQGYLWETGYKTGVYSTPLFPDVVPQLKAWKTEDLRLAIYSSGSVFAQKLLFGHVSVPDEASGGAQDTSKATVTGKRKLDSSEASTSGTVRKAAKTNVASELESESEDSTTENEKIETLNATGGAPHSSAAPDVEETEELKAVEQLTDLPEDDITNTNETEAIKDDRDLSVATRTEDLTHLIEDWFDTTNAGPKTVKESYVKIAEALKLQANEILFLSDSVQEIQAAIWAGMKAVVVDRPGNAPLETEYERSFPIMQALDGVGSAKPRFETPSLPYIDIGGTGQ